MVMGSREEANGVRGGWYMGVTPLEGSQGSSGPLVTSEGWTTLRGEQGWQGGGEEVEWLMAPWRNRPVCLGLGEQ